MEIKFVRGLLAKPIERGIRNNNPGNLKWSPINKWKGQTGKDDLDFAMFGNTWDGIRAMLLVLVAYVQAHDLDTIESIINRYDNSSHRSHEHYIDYCATVTGWDRKKVVSDTDDICQLAHAMVAFEIGSLYFTKQYFLDVMADIVKQGLITP